MKHALNITVSKERRDGGIMACRQLTVRERLLRFLLGNPVKLTVIVPGDSVDEVSIFEKREADACEVV
mgnify:CR=1 FL=1